MAKRYTTTLIIRETEMKITVRNENLLELLLSKRKEINAGKDVEKREPLCTVGGNVPWYSHYGKKFGVSSKILKIELLYDPAILLLGIYLKEMK